MAWKIENLSKATPKLKNPILIEGLPGIGNVGKVAADFIISELNAKKLFSFTSYSMPNSVFVNEHNLVELPSIELYYTKLKNGNDLLLLAGDVQPTTEEASYEFCEKLLDIVQTLKCKEIVTLGGIGLQAIPKVPKVYCTGNSKKIIEKYKKGTVLNNKLYGVVGPIIGASGLLVGLSKKRKIEAIAMLAETLGHPMYLGIKGAKEILKILNKKLSLGIDLKELEKDIKDVEEEILKRTDELSKVSKKSKKIGKDTDYIG